MWNLNNLLFDIDFGVNCSYWQSGKKKAVGDNLCIKVVSK